MDLLGPVLAYLGTVTTIVVAVVMSYDAFVYAPLHAPARRHSPIETVMPGTAKLGVTKPTAKPTPRLARLDSGAAEPVRGGVANVAAAPPAQVAAKRHAARRRTVMARRRSRWLARKAADQARDREWVYQQAPEAFGYADDAPAGLGIDRYQ